MAMIDTTTSSTELALSFEPQGVEEVPDSTILTRLNYFDGKFLRADDLRLEQDYMRRVAELGARAGGSGLVYGFDVTAGSGDQLTIGGGLAFDPAGRVLYMPAPFSVSLNQVIAATRNALAAVHRASAGSSTFEICTPEDKGEQPPPAPSGAEFYVITIAHAERACGDEEVFGRLCDDGCATSTDRAYMVEGVIVRAAPFQPRTPFVQFPGLTEAHIHSQLVSAYFADEKDFVPCQISKAGLLSGIWCHGAAAPGGWEVPIAVVGRLTSSTFVDEWVVRRERMDTPPRRYWQGRMCMRPWDTFLAQVLQFQCQLPSVLSGREGDSTSVDPCAAHVDVIREVSAYVADLHQALAAPLRSADRREAVIHAAEAAPIEGVPADQPAGTAMREEITRARAAPLLQADKIALIQRRLADVLDKAKLPSQHILLDGGLVELPPAGYLPVTPGTTPPVDEQVRRLMGPGVDLRFCVARHDYIPRAFESAQHMDRISLVEGIEDTARRPKVDVLVPDGVLGATQQQARGWDASVQMSGPLLLGIFEAEAHAAFAEVGEHVFDIPPRLFHGAARSATPSGGGLELEFAGLEPPSAGREVQVPLGGYLAFSIDADMFDLAAGAGFTAKAEAAVAATGREPAGATANLTGTFTVESRQEVGGVVTVTAKGNLDGNINVVGPNPRGGAGAADVEVQLTLSAAGSPPTFTAAVGRPGPEGRSRDLLLWASWQGSPLEVSAAFGQDEQSSSGIPLARLIVDSPLETTMADAKLTEDAAVFDAANQAHQDAVKGLETIDTVLDDRDYTGAIEKKLFDQGAASTGGVTATLDWVLFHRRRWKDCGTPSAPPPPPKPKPQVETTDYTVFGVKNSPLNVKLIGQLASRRDLAAFLKAAKPKAVTLGVATFTSDTSDFVDPTELKTLDVAKLEHFVVRAIVVSKTGLSSQPLVEQREKLIDKVGGVDVRDPAHPDAPFLAVHDWPVKTEHVLVLLTQQG